MIFMILLLGLGVGVLVGLLGIGGGVVLVPSMVYLLHMDQHLAQGTSLFILLPPIGLGALREYWKQGHVDLNSGILCALGMLFGAYPRAAVCIQPAPRARNVFGCADPSYRSAGADGVFEGRICLVENRVAADSGNVFGRHRGRNSGEENQAAKHAPGFCGNPGFSRRVAGARCVVALGKK